MNIRSNYKPAPETFAREALECLDTLYGFAMVLTKDSSVAADLVQETYVHALQSWEQFTPGTQLKSWLFAILRNIWINQYRREKRRSKIISIESDNDDLSYSRSFSDKDNSPEFTLLRALRIEQVCAAVESLPGAYREVVVLRDIEGFSYSEIASILRCAEGTVMSRLSRARQKLRGLLAQVI